MIVEAEQQNTDCAPNTMWSVPQVLSTITVIICFYRRILELHPGFCERCWFHCYEWMHTLAITWNLCATYQQLSVRVKLGNYSCFMLFMLDVKQASPTSVLKVTLIHTCAFSAKVKWSDKAQLLDRFLDTTELWISSHSPGTWSSQLLADTSLETAHLAHVEGTHLYFTFRFSKRWT